VPGLNPPPPGYLPLFPFLVLVFFWWGRPRNANCPVCGSTFFPFCCWSCWFFPPPPHWACLYPPLMTRMRRDDSSSFFAPPVIRICHLSVEPNLLIRWSQGPCFRLWLLAPVPVSSKPSYLALSGALGRYESGSPESICASSSF